MEWHKIEEDAFDNVLNKINSLLEHISGLKENPIYVFNDFYEDLTNKEVLDNLIEKLNTFHQKDEDLDEKLNKLLNKNIELESKIESQNDEYSSYTHYNTSIGKITFYCTNYQDDSNMDLFTQLMIKYTPTELYNKLKAL